MFADAGRNVATAADLLAGLMDPNAVRATIASNLRECEHIGDTATHRILRQLNTSFVTPFDREDIYRLAAALDDGVDRKLLTKLFSGDYGALETLKLRQVADLFEDAADALEHVAHAVETIAV